MKKEMLTIAIAKGYLQKESFKRFEKIGIHFDRVSDRQLFVTDKSGTYQCLIIRPWDVPTYVEEGGADLGIVGQDVLLEKAQENHVVKLLDLDFGKCKLVLAGPKDKMPIALDHNLKVATKFSNSTQTYFQGLGKKVSIIKLYGSIEIAPHTGLADIICDLTATGKSLEEHNLAVIDTLFSSSALLISNPTALRFYHDQVLDLIGKLQ